MNKSTDLVKKLRRRRKKRSVKRRPINVLASAVTTFGLYLGLWSIFASVRGDYDKAAYLILGAIICDMLDGTLARITHSTSEFGKELDSLADVVSFGVAPAVLIFHAFLYEEQLAGSAVGRTGAIMAIIFAICGALRLARYNVFQSGRRDSFIGLPIPAAGGTIASFVLFANYFGLRVAFWVLGPLTMTLAYLMVSTVRYPKDRLKSAFVVAPRNAFRMLALSVIVIAVFHYAITHSPVIVLFPLFAAYVLFGVVDTRYVLAKEQKTEAAASKSAKPPASPAQPQGLSSGGSAVSEAPAKKADVR